MKIFSTLFQEKYRNIIKIVIMAFFICDFLYNPTQTIMHHNQLENLLSYSMLLALKVAFRIVKS